MISLFNYNCNLILFINRTGIGLIEKRRQGFGKANIIYVKKFMVEMPTENKLVKTMQDADVPKWYIESCNKIQYLYPWGQCVDYVGLHWKLACYYRYFPMEYHKICDRPFL